MSIRVEWLNDEKTILCYTPTGGWNWQESQRLLDEWVRPLLADAKQSIGIVADLRQCRIFGGDVDLLIKRLRQIVRDSMHAKVLAVVGLPHESESPEFISVASIADATARLNHVLSKNLIA